MKKNFILLITLLTAFVSQAQVKLGSPFGDNMVLQQNADVAIWGSASPGCELKIVAGWNNPTAQQDQGSRVLPDDHRLRI